MGAANPNDPADKTRQNTDVASHTWFVVPAANTLCGDDPLCKDASSKGATACSGDPRTHRQGFLMASNSMLKNINFQGADRGRAGSEGTLCGPGAIELPGCVSGTGCPMWDAERSEPNRTLQEEEVASSKPPRASSNHTNGAGVVSNVVIQNVRLSDSVRRAEIKQMAGKDNGARCNRGEAFDGAGQHVRAHQVTFWAAKLPDSDRAAGRTHKNIMVENLVSMNSRADGLNVHGAVHGLTLQNSHLENSGALRTRQPAINTQLP